MKRELNEIAKPLRRGETLGKENVEKKPEARQCSCYYFLFQPPLILEFDFNFQTLLYVFNQIDWVSDQILE